MKNKYNAGLEIFAINGGLIGYLLTSDGEVISNIIICIISSLIAVAINIFCHLKEKDNRLTLAFLIANILVFIGCIVTLVIII